MKYILILILLSSCSGNCDFVINEYNNAKKIHSEKMNEASILSDQLDEMPIDSVLDHSLLEDELNFILIDVVMIEIQMEDYKKQNYDCLSDIN